MTRPHASASAPWYCANGPCRAPADARIPSTRTPTSWLADSDIGPFIRFIPLPRASFGLVSSARATSDIVDGVEVAEVTRCRPSTSRATRDPPSPTCGPRASVLPRGEERDLGVLVERLLLRIEAIADHHLERRDPRGIVAEHHRPGSDEIIGLASRHVAANFHAHAGPFWHDVQ